LGGSWGGNLNTGWMESLWALDEGAAPCEVGEGGTFDVAFGWFGTLHAAVVAHSMGPAVVKSFELAYVGVVGYSCVGREGAFKAFFTATAEFVGFREVLLQVGDGSGRFGFGFPILNGSGEYSTLPEDLQQHPNIS
jgi:hypothetical protein